MCGWAPSSRYDIEATVPQWDHQHRSSLPMLMVDGSHALATSTCQKSSAAEDWRKPPTQWWEASGLGRNGADVPHWNTELCSRLLCHGETQGWRGDWANKIPHILTGQKIQQPDKPKNQQQAPWHLPEPQKGQLVQLTAELLSQSALDFKLFSLLSFCCCWVISKVSNGASHTRHLCSWSSSASGK